MQNTTLANPLCEPLTGNLGGLWRYRVENFRIVAKIKDDKYIVLAIHIEHRSKVYKKSNLKY
ncbi:type II toxin-antitoxin system RelE/ParE family toxin [uncultured Anaerovibrio sp.]|uniref:type II toxin-antitoxin system RelE family toxin n=1 Tax=uncultured Anaerovibrio sp. TaxID=361586 RepID=UPI003439E4FE